MPKRGVDQYSDFFERAFSERDIEEILEEGGQTSLGNFKKISRDKNRDNGFWEAMFNKKNKSARGNLGTKIFQKFFEDGQVTVNKAERIIVRTGEKTTFKGKTYKGGQFLPKDFFKRK